MITPIRIALLFAILLLTTREVPAKPRYQAAVDSIEKRRVTLAAQWAGKDLSAEGIQDLAQELVGHLETLAPYWVGTNWGRGIPQSDTPLEGKINCGTFVGTLLRDIGFSVNVKKLQRQPSQGIIRTFVGRKRTRKLVGTSMPEFLEGVRAMGPGLYIVGLHLHVGLLLQTETELMYMHSSIETGKVVIEPAETAWTITSSNYRVVGKILSAKNIRDWLKGRTIEVKGKNQ